jgi:putative transcriptional regulator
MAYKKITSRMTKSALKATDWAAIDAMTDKDIARQMADDDEVAPEILPVDVKAIRSATGLSQGGFAARYKIPVGTLRDWEQGRKQPDTTARAYLWVIGKNPKMVAESLKR